MQTGRDENTETYSGTQRNSTTIATHIKMLKLVQFIHFVT